MPARWFWCLVVAAAVAAGAATTRPADPQRVALAITQLGDPSFSVREQATQLLWSAGPAARPALEQAARDSDPEVAARAREILADFQCGIGPDSPQQVIDLVRAYRRGGGAERRAAVESLFLLGPKVYPVQARLCDAELDAQVKDWIARRLSAQAAAAVPALLQTAQHAAAEQLLELALADGSEQSARTYAAYHVVRGGAAAKAAQLRAQMDGPNAARYARALAFLHRAADDLPAAQRAAEQTGDAELLDSLLFERGDFKALAQRLRQRFGEDADIERLGFLAAYQQLAGDRHGFDHTLQLMHRYADGPKAGRELLAKALLLNGRAEDGITLYISAGNVQTAFELLCARQMYAQGIELAKKHDGGADSLGIRCAHARTLHYLGRRNEAQAIFDDLGARFAAASAVNEQFELIEAEVQCGLNEQALEHAMRLVGEAGRTGALQALFQSLFGGDSADAVRWWNYFRSRYPNETGQQTLRRMGDLFARKLTVEQLARLGQEATQFARGMGQRDRSAFLALVARTLFAAGQEALGQNVLDQAVRLGGDIELGNLAATRAQWKLAAELYEAASRQQKDAVSMGLRGWALIAAGQEKEGRALVAQATLLPLADGRQRLRLAETLERAGFREGAAEQIQLAMRTAAPWSGELIEAWTQAARQAARRGDHQQAADCWRRAALACLQSGAAFVNPRNYIVIPFLTHKHQALACLRAGDTDGAIRHIQTCESLVPGEITLAIDLVPALQTSDIRQQADALFARTLAVQEQLCRAFPDSPAMHNSLAWLRVRCGRGLEQALASARRAVELDPKNTAALDTLAEVHFQMGQREQAVALLRTCIELEPWSQRHRLALERVRQARADSDPIE